MKRNLKLAAVERQTLLRRREEHFRVLRAIAEMLPTRGDHQEVDGRARGCLAARELAAYAGVSGKAVDRALQHWLRWRVLWVRWRGRQSWEIRFDRAVVGEVLA